MSGVRSIERAFAVLRVLSAGSAGLTEIARRLGLPKSTVARILASLETERAVVQEAPGGGYRLGPALRELAGASVDGRTLVATARPHLVEITATCHETSGISVRDGNVVHYLDHVGSPENVLVRDWTGETAPLHTVPSGLVLLAAAGADDVADYLDGPLERLTEHTVVDPDALRDRLDRVLADGHAWVHEEYADGITSVGVPVTGPDGAVLAALHVHGPSYRFPGECGPQVVELLRRAADRMTDQLRT